MNDQPLGQPALQELVDGMARSLGRLEEQMNPPRQHLCTATVIRKKPGGMTELEPCRKIAAVRRVDGKGFWCAFHAGLLMPQPPKRRGA